MPDVNQQVLYYANSQLDKKVKQGECWDFAQEALKYAQAKTSYDYGTVTATADYVWGTAVTLGSVRAGDIVQFKNYRYDKAVKETNADGSWKSSSGFQERPHHTAIVTSVGSNGELEVLEQNAPAGSKVHKTKLYFSAGSFTTAEGTTKVETTIKVTGTVWYYRPQPKTA